MFTIRAQRCLNIACVIKPGESAAFTTPGQPDCFLKGDAHAFPADARRHKLQRFFRLADIADVYFQAAKQGRQAMHYEDAADDDLRRKLYTRSVSSRDVKLGWDQGRKSS